LIYLIFGYFFPAAGAMFKPCLEQSKQEQSKNKARTKQASGQIGDRIFLTQMQTRGNGLFRRSVKFLKFHSYRQFLLREEGAQDYKRIENSY
jgi:hypothetical protein